MHLTDFWVKKTGERADAIVREREREGEREREREGERFVIKDDDTTVLF